MERWSEWSKAVALKAIEEQSSGGSNPSLSATAPQKGAFLFPQSINQAIKIEMNYYFYELTSI